MYDAAAVEMVAGGRSGMGSAVRSFARTWRSDLKERKIGVSVVSPGPIETPGLSGWAANEEQETQIQTGPVSQVPLGRRGTADEIAKAALFLAL
jgi:NAD(P)-dependent dehydrogenase (short-subunit alcohol dehydrogenase family)